MTILGQLLTDMRHQHGWTQQDLADRLGITRSQVSNVEADNSDTSARAVIALLFEHGWPPLAPQPVEPTSLRLPAVLRGDGPCMDCGTLDTPVWFAPNVLWNRVVGGPGTISDPGGLLCPQCFISRVREAGLHVEAWQLIPEWHWETVTERADRTRP